MFHRSRSRRLAVRFPFPKNLYLKGGVGEGVDTAVGDTFVVAVGEDEL